MKKTYLLAAILIFGFSTLSIAQNVPNGGFESWTSGDPDDWQVTNTINFNTVTQSTDAYSGMYSAKGQSVEYNNDNVIVEFKNNGNGSDPGFPVSQKYTSLRFYYKFDEGKGDKFVISLSMRTDSITVGSAFFEIEDDQTTWKEAIIPIDYTSTKLPKFCSIQMILADKVGSANPSLDSYIMLDDVVLSLLTGIEDVSYQENSIQLFPQPSENIVNMNLFSSKNVKTMSFSIFDLSGKVIKRFDVQNVKIGENQRIIDLSGISSGVYVLQSADQQFNTRVVIK